MIKKSTLYKILITLLLITMISPAVVGADSTEGTLTIHKYEQEASQINPDGDGSKGQQAEGKPLAGVEYEIIQTHSYDGDAWTEVTNGKKYILTTDINGEVSTKMPLGRYSVKETSGPSHVNLNPDTFYVDIPMTNKAGTELNYDVHIYPKNETIRGAVELTKIDGDSKELLAGVKFNLLNEDGTLVDLNGETVFVTDNKGQIKIDNLAYGKYHFKEIQTIEGYLIGNPKANFEIIKSKEVVKIELENFKKPEIDKTVDKNNINRGGVVTYALDNMLPGNIDEYTTYTITDELDSRLSYVDGSWTVTGVDASALTFEQTGQTLTWKINDFSKFKNVKQIKVSFQAKIAVDATPNEVINNKATINFDNKHKSNGTKETDPVGVTPTAGNLMITKVDSKTGETLSGATFELRDLSGKVIQTGTSNDKGEVSFTELDYAEYQLVETKAPNGYRKLTKPINITIDKDNNNVKIEVENSKSNWELPKTGGMGTTLFTAVGLILMSLAIYLYTRRKNQAA